MTHVFFNKVPKMGSRSNKLEKEPNYVVQENTTIKLRRGAKSANQKNEMIVSEQKKYKRRINAWRYIRPEET